MLQVEGEPIATVKKISTFTRGQAGKWVANNVTEYCFSFFGNWRELEKQLYKSI